MPDKPRQELAVAIVGPLINLAIAGALWIGITASGGTTRITEPTSLPGALLAQLMWINIGLAVFNLLPAFPMDGGRVLRAVLAMRMHRERATEIAAKLGKGFAVVIGIVGLFYNPWLLLIAFVVWTGAAQEAALVQIKSVITGV